MVVVQNKGYTIIELIVVIVVVGIFSLIAINKASYAFVDSDVVNEETEEMILIKTSTAYANSILETLKNDDIYVTGKDIEDAGYLVDDEHTLSNVKLKLSYNAETNSAKVEILK